jgi:hypothetical protein
MSRLAAGRARAEALKPGPSDLKCGGGRCRGGPLHSPRPSHEGGVSTGVAEAKPWRWRAAAAHSQECRFAWASSTRRISRPISAVRCASALLMDSESWFAVDVFEPKTTTTPNRAAKPATITIGSNVTTPEWSPPSELRRGPWPPSTPRPSSGTVPARPQVPRSALRVRKSARLVRHPCRLMPREIARPLRSIGCCRLPAATT